MWRRISLYHRLFIIAVAGLVGGASYSALRAACITMMPPCKDDCKVHPRWCFWIGGKFSGELYDEPVVPAEPFWCCEIPNYGIAAEKKEVNRTYYNDCDPDCPSDPKTTGAPKGDHGEPVKVVRKITCSGKSS